MMLLILILFHINNIHISRILINRKKTVYAAFCYSLVLLCILSFGHNEILINSFAVDRNEITEKDVRIGSVYSQDPDVIMRTNTTTNSMSFGNNVPVGEDDALNLITTQNANPDPVSKINAKETGCRIDGIRSNFIYNTDLTGTNRDDLLVGANEDEKINGKRGDDIVQSQGGNDLIFGNVGKDKLQGGSASDTLFGEGNDDFIVAGDGDDYLCGGRANDIMYAGSGDDIMEGGRGADFFDCGDGQDIVLDFNLVESDVISNNCENM